MDLEINGTKVLLQNKLCEHARWSLYTVYIFLILHMDIFVAISQILLVVSQVVSQAFVYKVYYLRHSLLS